MDRTLGLGFGGPWNLPTKDKGIQIPNFSHFDRSFWQGFAMALADLNRQRDQPTMIKGVMDGHGITIKMLKQAGVEGYDLKELRKCMK